ncbi:hypothetical protein TVAG_482880, partial [Trichomonas vaginalis G3]
IPFAVDVAVLPSHPPTAEAPLPIALPAFKIPRPIHIPGFAFVLRVRNSSFLSSGVGFVTVLTVSTTVSTLVPIALPTAVAPVRIPWVTKSVALETTLSLEAFSAG